jgi:hypothetical protein
VHENFSSGDRSNRLTSTFFGDLENRQQKLCRCFGQYGEQVMFQFKVF